MKILSWNCRGLGNPSAVLALLRLIRLQNPCCVFLMETRLKSFEFEGIKQKCGFNSCLAIDCRGNGKERAGGLALMWREPMQITISSYTLNHIGGHFTDGEFDQHCYISYIYGYPEECNKRKTWQLVEELSASVGRNTLDTFRFIDLGFEGHPFTWTNKRELEENIQCHV